MNAKTHNDSALATTAGRAPRIAAFKAWGTAEGAAGRALVACFLTCAEHGKTSPEEVAEARGWLVPGADGGTVPNGSAKAYAATFNAAAKAADILGIAKAKDVIEKAAKLPGKAHENIADALRKVGTLAKDRAITKADAKAARALMADAVKAVEAERAEKAQKAKAAKGARGQNAATTNAAKAEMGTAAALSGADWRANVAAVRLASNNAHKLAMPEGREAACRAYLKALADVAEMGAQLGV